MDRREWEYQERIWQDWGRYMLTGGINFADSMSAQGALGTTIDRGGYSDPTAAAGWAASQRHADAETTQQAFRMLSRAGRRVMWLRYASEHTYSWGEIANLTRLCEKTVRRLHDGAFARRVHLAVCTKVGHANARERLKALFHTLADAAQRKTSREPQTDF